MNRATMDGGRRLYQAMVTAHLNHNTDDLGDLIAATARQSDGALQILSALSISTQALAYALEAMIPDPAQRDEWWRKELARIEGLA